MKKQNVALGFIVLISATLFLSWMLLPTGEDSESSLEDVGFWAYQIQGIDDDGAVDQLAASYYDMLVIEPTRSDKDSMDFDTQGAVSQLHASSGANLESKIVVAYIDIGEAEDWRWYWEENWTAPTETTIGVPDFLISIDPDGWEGNYPVAFWDDRWKDLILYDSESSIQQILDDGFDGIYMDWIEAYEHEPVAEAADIAGLDSQQEMIDFISEIRTYCKAQDPDFLVIAQNALDIYEGNTEYFDVIDAVAQEHILFDGVADSEWGETGSGDTRIPESGEEGYSTHWYTEKLDRYIAEGKTVFVVDYATSSANVAEAYAFSASHGYIGFVTQVALSQLPTTIPPNYPS